jgi:lipopolysaccharide/colanic/teichoic acid biosynthesis glycosyltransferase
MKRAFDKVFVAIFIIGSSPLAMAIALAIVIEGVLRPSARGPVLHRETRVTAGRMFTLYKFRILTAAGEAAVTAGAVPKEVENDSTNLTHVGTVLKRIGLDELAQLLNIARGEMTFVGPRPKPPNEYEVELELGHRYRAELRAGLSGPAQMLKGTVRRRDDDVEADFAYAALVQSGSSRQVLSYDLRALWTTTRVLFRATGE